MDTFTNQIPPEINQPSDRSAITEHVNPIEQSAKKPFHISTSAVIIILAITAGILLGILFGQTTTKTPDQAVTPTATPIPIETPTPIRTFSPIASDSAFLSIESSIISLSTSLSAVEVTDPQLSPPSIELELGFPTQ